MPGSELMYKFDALPLNRYPSKPKSAGAEFAGAPSGRPAYLRGCLALHWVLPNFLEKAHHSEHMQRLDLIPHMPSFKRISEGRDRKGPSLPTLILANAVGSGCKGAKRLILTECFFI